MSVVDLGERRQVLDLRKQVENLQRKVDEQVLRQNPTLARRVASLCEIETQERFAAVLAKLKPVLVELIEWRGTALADDNAEPALLLAIACAGVLDQLQLVAEFPARVAARRATLLAEYQRQIAAYPGIHEPPQVDKT